MQVPNALGAISGAVQLVLYAWFYRTTNWEEEYERSSVQMSESTPWYTFTIFWMYEIITGLLLGIVLILVALAMACKACWFWVCVHEQVWKSAGKKQERILNFNLHKFFYIIQMIMIRFIGSIWFVLKS